MRKVFKPHFFSESTVSNIKLFTALQDMNSEAETLGTASGFARKRPLTDHDSETKAHSLKREMGSQASLTSRLSLRSTVSTGSSRDVKKGIN